jgi:hypothetical protein
MPSYALAFTYFLSGIMIIGIASLGADNYIRYAKKKKKLKKQKKFL